MEKSNSTASSSGQEISEKEDREKGNLDTTASVEDSDVERPTGLETANISGDEIRNKPDSEIDEGGFWGWSTVAGAWIIQFTGFGYANAYGVYQDFYTRMFLTSFSSSDISWIGSIQVFLLMACGFVSGRLFDKGYFYALVIGASILLVFCLFMLSLCKENQYYQLILSQGIGIGLASGFMYIPAYGAVAQHFPSPHKRALAMGIIASGSSCGGLLHPIMLNNLFHGSVGFANGVRASAGFIAGMQILAISLMRPKYPDKASVKTIKLKVALKKFWKDSAYLLLTLAMFCLMQGIFFPVFYLQLDSILHGLDPTFAFYSLAILNGASMLGRIIPGFLARQLGVFNMLCLSSFCCTAIIWSMFGVLNVPGVVFIGILFGFFSGSYVTLLGPALALLATDPTEIGVRMGLSFVFAGLGSLIGSPINGALLSTHFAWWRPITYSGVISSMATLVFFLARQVVARRRGNHSWIV